MFVTSSSTDYTIDYLQVVGGETWPLAQLTIITPTACLISS